MLVDSVSVVVKAGNGGDGAVTFRSGKGGPDGGRGGDGGNIYFQGSHNITDLRQFRFEKKITAADGVRGQRQNIFGKNALHTTIFVPLGTSITDLNLGRVLEIVDTTTPLLLAHGGKGGQGNAFKSATNQAPRYSKSGTLGEEKKLHLELKIIAEIGLIGLPNAGKSSLLAALTNATPKIGNFPFTTLEPNIGMLDTHALADIPGLIEGASRGQGLGVKFLKHIEKTKILLHCIESTEADVQKDYETVRHEFENYNASLLEKPEIILLTKTDLVDKKIVEKHSKIFQKKGKKVLSCSIYDQKSLDELKETVEKLL